MTRTEIPDQLISTFNEFISSLLGLHFPHKRRQELVRGVTSAAQDLGFNDVLSFIYFVMSKELSQEQLGILTHHLTIGETYFFRDKKLFQALENHIIPQIVMSRRGRTRQHLRVWSAGCCTGEEPYSLAIAFDRVIPAPKDWRINILATDINEGFLQKARQGMYSEWSFRALPDHLKQKYFRQGDDCRFEISHDIRKMVTFSRLNLVDRTYPSPLTDTERMDVILCRNVLMYFAEEPRAQVVNRFCRSLAPGGWLVLSPSEGDFARHSGLVPVNFSGVTVFRKTVQDQTYPACASAAVRLPDHLQLQTTQLPININRYGEMPDHVKGRRPQTVSRPGKEADREAAKAKKPVGLPDIQVALPKDQTVSLDADSLACQARECADAGRLTEAGDWCRKAIQAEKLNPANYYLLSSILQEQGFMEASIKALKQAIYLDPGFVLAHVALGHITRGFGKLDDSLRHFQSALTLLKSMNSEDVLPYSDGLTVGHLVDLVRSMIPGE
ncbi:MAG: chemotaxis protein CheR [Deltaproteobacteria bacterium]|nr:chemotaxis protein CheR [Deltaproteobacteria bacterium]